MDSTAQFDQNKATATENLGRAKTFLVITSPEYEMGDDEEREGEDVRLEVVMGCDDWFMRTALDVVSRHAMARMIFPEMFDEFGRPTDGS